MDNYPKPSNGCARRFAPCLTISRRTGCLPNAYASRARPSKPEPKKTMPTGSKSIRDLFIILINLHACNQGFHLFAFHETRKDLAEFVRRNGETATDGVQWLISHQQTLSNTRGHAVAAADGIYHLGRRRLQAIELLVRACENRLAAIGDNHPLRSAFVHLAQRIEQLGIISQLAAKC